jgi:hypothetical protein
VLIPFSQTGQQQLATRYLVEAEALECAVTAALSLDAAQIQAKQAAARDFYLQNDRAFRERLAAAVTAMIDGAGTVGATRRLATAPGDGYAPLPAAQA